MALAALPVSFRLLELTSALVPEPEYEIGASVPSFIVVPPTLAKTALPVRSILISVTGAVPAELFSLNPPLCSMLPCLADESISPPVTLSCTVPLLTLPDPDLSSLISLAASFCLKPFFKVRVVVPPVIGALAPDATEAKTRSTARAVTVAAADKIDPRWPNRPGHFIHWVLPFPPAFPNERLHGENGEGGNRTHDTTIFSRVLYQLSYLAWACAAGPRADGKASDRRGVGLIALGGGADSCSPGAGRRRGRRGWRSSPAAPRPTRARRRRCRGCRRRS